MTNRRIQEAVGEQDGDAVDDGITAAAAGAAYSVRVRQEGLAADGADEPAEVFGLEGHRNRVLGSWFEVRGRGAGAGSAGRKVRKAVEVRATLQVLRLRASRSAQDDDGGVRGCAVLWSRHE
jgi:hypothetical protein